LSGLSFCINNRTSNIIEFLLIKDFEKKLNPVDLLDHLKKFLTVNSELSQSFSKILVIYQNELSSLVPKSLYDENYSADYIKFNSKILKSDFLSSDEISINESVNVYVPYMNINNFIFDTFGVFEYKHSSTILIDSLLQKEKKSEDATLYLNVNKQHFELVAIKNQKLLLYNSFEYSTKEDVIYYLLFTIEQLQLNPETVKLNLMGLIEKDDQLYQIIYTYIRFVEFYTPNYQFEFKPELKPNQHHHAIILNSF
jgi:hypothetical protein